MRVLIPTMGTRGDVQPYIALAKKLNESGFQATIATHPCWRSLIEQYDIEYKPIGPDINIETEAAEIRKKSKNWILGAIKTMQFVFKIIEGSSMEIKEMCEKCDLVVSTHSYIGAIEAEASSTPFISVTLHPDSIPKKLQEKSAFKYFIDKIVSAAINPLMMRAYNKLRRQHGLKSIKSSEELVSPFLNIIPISTYVYERNQYWEEKNKLAGYWFSSKYEEYATPEDLVDFLNSGSPPIVIALGAMAFEDNKEESKLKILIDAINKTGMRAIIQGFNKSLENFQLPDNIISIGSIPHSWLFKRAFCVIHHGGFGTTASTLMAGVPSIIIPHALDQYFWANKLYELDVAVKPLKAKELCERNLVDSINSIIKDYSLLTHNAKGLSDKINSEDGLEYTVDLIKEVLKRIN
jgi:UDP:flavonoid glycosyltransferase YjiC (YdhE family)